MILSPERIKEMRAETRKRISEFYSNAEGNFTQEEIGAMWDEGDRVILEAQAKLTADEYQARIVQIFEELELHIGVPRIVNHPDPPCYLSFKNFPAFEEFKAKALKKE